MESAKKRELNKHQVKTEATLHSVLDAAEAIFVRDGYERAQIETIAAQAGRTKGSVYAHFRSKEDIFFALLERKAKERRETFHRVAQGESSEARKLEIIKDIFLEAFNDESWPILMLEFKLFALRNKASFRRVKKLYQLIYEDVVRNWPIQGPLGRSDRNDRVQIALGILRGIPSGIALEKQFNPTLTSSGETRQALAKVFDALFQEENPAQGADHTSNSNHIVGAARTRNSRKKDKS